jgi:hypothetical protein
VTTKRTAGERPSLTNWAVLLALALGGCGDACAEQQRTQRYQSCLSHVSEVQRTIDQGYRYNCCDVAGTCCAKEPAP